MVPLALETTKGQCDAEDLRTIDRSNCCPINLEELQRVGLPHPLSLSGNAAIPIILRAPKRKTGWWVNWKKAYLMQGRYDAVT